MKQTRLARKLLAAALAVLLLCGAFPFDALAPDARATGGIWAGSGTMSAPYLIEDAEDLWAVANRTRISGISYNDTYFLLRSDIDLQDLSYNPIGTADHPFCGTFMGDGHKIERVNLNGQGTDRRGLFGVIGAGGTVSNLTVSGSVSNAEYAGGIAGTNYGTIEYCEFYGSVSCTGSGDICGGIVGENHGTVRGCINCGTVSCSEMGALTGGVAGKSEETVADCTNRGTVSGVRDVGGIAGSAGGTVSGCLNEGPVSGEDRVGGIAGTAASVRGCTNKGTVKGTVSETGALPEWGGGVVGWLLTGGNVSDCVNSGEIAFGLRTGGIVGGAEDDCAIDRCTNAAKTVSGSNFVGGVIGAGGDNIILSDCVNSGVVTSTEVICGGVVGQLRFNASVSRCVNSGAVNGKGGIIGELMSGTVTDCLNTGTVTGTSNRIGGIVGLAIKNSTASKIQNCTNRGTISNSDSITGGIVGQDNGDTWEITGCVNAGRVSGTSNTGGIVGVSNGIVTNCRNEGEVTGTNDVGGICGDAAEINHCQNTGSVSSSEDNVGGIAGRLGTSIEDCVNTGEVIGSSSVGGIAGLADAGNNTSKVIRIERCRNGGGLTKKGERVGGEVTASGERVGGILGYAKNPCEIVQCGNAGAIKADNNDVGGIAGKDESGVTFEDCYDLGSVYGLNNVGGILGYAMQSVALTRTYCKAPKDGIDCRQLSGESGALTGDEDRNASLDFTGNYWWSRCADRARGCKSDALHDGDDYGYYYYEDRFSDRSKFPGWDFDKVWYIDAEEKAPLLRWERDLKIDPAGCTEPGMGGSGGAGGAGNTVTAERVYIDDVAALKELRDNVNNGKDYAHGVVFLRADLDLGGEKWEPIGTYTEGGANNRPFSGIFYGQGHSIKGLRVDATSAGGLFGYVREGEIQDLAVFGSVESGSNCTGGVVGMLVGTVENCMFFGSVTGTSFDDGEACVGGIVGSTGSSSYRCGVENCGHVGAVSAERGYAGGVVGRYWYDTTVSQCFHSGGTVTTGGGKPTGAVVGRVSTVSGVDYCYALAGSANTIVGESNSHSDDLGTALFSEEEMRTAAGYVGWDIGSEGGHVWGMGEDHPILQCIGGRVTLVPNGADGDPRLVWLPRAKMQLTRVPFTRTAYDFTLWNTKPDGKGTDCRNGETLPGGGEYYAQWQPTPYTLTLALDGGTGSESLAYTIESKDVIPTPAKTDCGFGGWEVTVADGGWTLGERLGAAAYQVTGRYGSATLTALWLTPEAAPNASFYAEGADCGWLMGVEAGMEYSLDGGVKWRTLMPEDVSSGTADILAGVGVGNGIQVHRAGNGTTTLDSAPQIINVTKAGKPEGLTGEKSSAAGNDGKITGLDTGKQYEYRLSTATDYTNARAGADAITGLAPGIYLVRVKASGAMLASEDAEVKVGTLAPKPEPTPEASFAATGYDTGTLSNVATGMQYKIGDGAWQSITAASVSLTDLAPCIIYVKQPGDGLFTADSTAQEIAVTRAATPSLTVTQPTSFSGTGSVATDSTHEYSTDGTSWTACTGALTGLAQGSTIYVRVKASGTVLTSANQTVTISNCGGTQENTPNATFTANGPDSGELSGLTPSAAYTVSGAGLAATDFTADADGKYAIASGMAAGTLSIVKKGNGTTTTDSAAQNIDVDKAATPSGLGKTDCTTSANNDGTITGVTAAMEYKKSDATSWTAISGTIVMGLVPGSYYVRVKASGTVLASADSAALTVSAYVPPEQVAAPTFDPPAGAVDAGTEIAISCATDGATIHYTTDGSDPTAASPVYSGVYTVNADTVIRAFAVKDGMTPSAVSTASYTIKTYTVTVTNDGHGTGSASPASGAKGTLVTLTSTPNAGYHFKEWQVVSGGVTVTNNSFTIGTANVTVKAVFEQDAPTSYTVTVVNGTGSGKYAVGATVTIKADKAPSGKVFDKWTSSDGVSFANAYSVSTTFKMPAKNVTVTATYKDAPYVPSYEPDPTPPVYPPTVIAEHCTVTVSPQNPKAGDKVTVTVAPDEGWQLNTLTVTDAASKAVEVKKQADETYLFTQPYGKVTIKAVCVPTTPTLTIAELLARFSDLKPGAWYLEPVRYMVERGFMRGMGDGTFAPNAETTQGMMEQILYNIDGGELIAPAENEDWWAAADGWAEKSGVTSGVAAHDPSAPATRETDIVMMFNYAKSRGYDTTARADLSTFSDADGVSDWAKEAMAWAVAVGIINGTVDKDGNVILDAQGTATRAQVAAITQRFCENVAK